MTSEGAPTGSSYIPRVLTCEALDQHTSFQKKSYIKTMMKPFVDNDSPSSDEHSYRGNPAKIRRIENGPFVTDSEKIKSTPMESTVSCRKQKKVRHPLSSFNTIGARHILSFNAIRLSSYHLESTRDFLVDVSLKMCILCGVDYK